MKFYSICIYVSNLLVDCKRFQLFTSFMFRCSSTFRGLFLSKHVSLLLQDMLHARQGLQLRRLGTSQCCLQHKRNHRIRTHLNAKKIKRYLNSLKQKNKRLTSARRIWRTRIRRSGQSSLVTGTLKLSVESFRE